MYISHLFYYLMVGSLIFWTTLWCVIRISISGQTCLSCSGVARITDCTQVSICRDDEVCYMHQYLTESKQDKHDFGCSYPELCIKGYSGPVFGRSLGGGHHMLCQGCCNDTNICNMRIPCEVDNTHNANAAKNLPRECEDINSTTSGVFTIYPDGTRAVQVYCFMTNHEKWTVIQRRFNGSVDFYRTWDEYKTGFGSPHGEYWLGNDNIHKISSASGHMLSIYMEDFDDAYRYANYSIFMIGDEYHRYQLTITGFKGTSGIGDSLAYHENMPFSTKDNDNSGGGDCAVANHGAWWYGLCKNSNLNGPYTAGPAHKNVALEWEGWRNDYSLKKTIMMIRRKHN